MYVLTAETYIYMEQLHVRTRTQFILDKGYTVLLLYKNISVMFF